MMMNKKSNRTYLPRTDELTRTIEQLMAQQRQNGGNMMDVKAIHAQLLLDHETWNVPQRRTAKFVKRLQQTTGAGLNSTPLLEEPSSSSLADDASTLTTSTTASVRSRRLRLAQRLRSSWRNNSGNGNASVRRNATSTRLGGGRLSNTGDAQSVQSTRSLRRMFGRNRQDRTNSMPAVVTPRASSTKTKTGGTTTTVSPALTTNTPKTSNKTATMTTTKQAAAPRTTTTTTTTPTLSPTSTASKTSMSEASSAVLEEDIPTTTTTSTTTSTPQAAPTTTTTSTPEPNQGSSETTTTTVAVTRDLPTSTTASATEPLVSSSKSSWSSVWTKFMTLLILAMAGSAMVWWCLSDQAPKQVQSFVSHQLAETWTWWTSAPATTTIPEEPSLETTSSASWMLWRPLLDKLSASRS